MDISINGKPADIIPDKEKTLGELLAALEQWLAGSGYRLSGLRINGETVNSAGMDEAFKRELEGISRLEIVTSSWLELAAEALADTWEVLRAWEDASFEDRGQIGERWEESPAAGFLAGEIPDMFALVSGTLKGDTPGPAEISKLIEERLREIGDPRGEFILAESLVTGVAGRLEELPLDIQTGKDGRAAETIQLFSHITEKLFRLRSLLKLAGFSPNTPRVEPLPAPGFIEEFDAALKELLAAYEIRDTVLVGDLAEYELAPRLRSFYGSLKDSIAVSS